MQQTLTFLHKIRDSLMAIVRIDDAISPGRGKGLQTLSPLSPRISKSLCSSLCSLGLDLHLTTPPKNEDKASESHDGAMMGNSWGLNLRKN